MKAPKMPEEYKARSLTPGGYVKSTPREWSTQEIEWIKNLRAQGYSFVEIAESVDRTETSVRIKAKRLTKETTEYNDAHREEKYQVNREFLQKVQPKTILDVYAGIKPFYTVEAKKAIVITNDINPDTDTLMHMDALKLLCGEYLDGAKYDLVDLDPFGSAYECLDLAIKIAQKGLCVTLGEMGQKRWHRLDYIRTRYGIEYFEDFTAENLVKHIQQIGLRNKKNLEVFCIKNWTNISRVWFTISPAKITEQWEKKTEQKKPVYTEDDLKNELLDLRDELNSNGYQVEVEI